MDVFSRLPVYVQLFEKLKKELESGRLGEPGAVVSARDIARKYNLSRDTVKRAIGELLSIGYIARRRGRGFEIQELVPKRLCLNIGIVASYAQPGRDYFYGKLIGGIEGYCRKNNFLVTWFGNDIDVTFLQELYAKNRVDGYVFVAVEDCGVINLFANAGVPCVSADYHSGGLNCDSVTMDTAEGCDLAVKSLLREGAHNFHVVTGKSFGDYASQERKTGYARALAENGVDLGSVLFSHVDEDCSRIKNRPVNEIMAERYLEIAGKSGPEVTYLTAYGYCLEHLLWASRKLYPAGKVWAASFAGIAPHNCNGCEVREILVDSAKIGETAAKFLLQRVLRGDITLPPRHEKVAMTVFAP